MSEIYVSHHPLFRSLNKVEVERFRQYARDHEPPPPDSFNLSHPVCRAEWRQQGKAVLLPLSEELRGFQVIQ